MLQLDLEDSATAREAWRSVKRNRVGLSIGYVTKRSHNDTDGTTVLDEIDLFEISIVPAPANETTRILDTKTAADERDIREEAKQWISEILSTPDSKSLNRAQPTRPATRERAPVRIASFEC